MLWDGNRQKAEGFERMVCITSSKMNRKENNSKRFFPRTSDWFENFSIWKLFLDLVSWAFAQLTCKHLKHLLKNLPKQAPTNTQPSNHHKTSPLITQSTINPEQAGLPDHSSGTSAPTGTAPRRAPPPRSAGGRWIWQVHRGAWTFGFLFWLTGFSIWIMLSCLSFFRPRKNETSQEYHSCNDFWICLMSCLRASIVLSVFLAWLLFASLREKKTLGFEMSLGSQQSRIWTSTSLLLLIFRQVVSLRTKSPEGSLSDSIHCA